MTKSKAFDGGACGGILLAIFCIWTLRIWLASVYRPEIFERPEQPQNQTVSLLANETLTIAQPCDDSNWSAGSAFFTLTALTFGYIAHPRGCMIFDRAGRMWRLTPLFALLETCLLWGRIFFSAMRRPGPSFRVICYALMAVRLCNSWHPHEMAEALEPEQENDEEAEEGHLLPDSGEDHFEILSEAYVNVDDHGNQATASSTPAVELKHFNRGMTGRPATKLRPSTTWPRLASSKATPIEPHASVFMHRSEQTITPQPLTASKYELLEAQSSAAQEQLIKSALAEVAKYDHGPSYRVFIWIPMILQIVKLLVVSGSGSILTQLSGWAYFISWATIELFMITIAQRLLKKPEHSQAVSLCKQFMNPLKHSTSSAQSSRSEFTYRDGTPLRRKIWLMGSIFAGAVAMYNAALTLILLFHDASVGDTYLAAPHGFFGSAFYLLKMLLLWGLTLLVLVVAGFLIAFPVPMLLAQKMLLLGWKFLKHSTRLDLGSLWFEHYVNDLQPMWPAYISMYNFMILMLFHTGIWWWQPFQCWETGKPSFYDWLG